MALLFNCLKSHVDCAEKRKKKQIELAKLKASSTNDDTAKVQTESKNLIRGLRANLSSMLTLDSVPECGPSQPDYVSPRRTKYKQDILAAAGYEPQRAIFEP